MLADTNTACCRQIANLREHLDTLPEDLKPFAEVLNKCTRQILATSFAESLKLIAELGLQEIARAPIPATQQIEPDQLERSKSNAT